MKNRGSSPNKMDAPDRHNGQRDASLSVRPLIRLSFKWNLTQSVGR